MIYLKVSVLKEMFPNGSYNAHYPLDNIEKLIPNTLNYDLNYDTMYCQYDGTVSESDQIEIISEEEYLAKCSEYNELRRLEALEQTQQKVRYEQLLEQQVSDLKAQVSELTIMLGDTLLGGGV